MTDAVFIERKLQLALDQNIFHNHRHQVSYGLTKSTSLSTITAWAGTVAIIIDMVYTLAEAATMRLLI